MRIVRPANIPTVVVMHHALTGSLTQFLSQRGMTHIMLTALIVLIIIRATLVPITVTSSRAIPLTPVSIAVFVPFVHTFIAVRMRVAFVASCTSGVRLISTSAYRSCSCCILWLFPANLSGRSRDCRASR